MLLLALGGVVLGFVFLLASLLTDNAAWAWGCIAVCVLAAVLLVVDVVRRRRPTPADAPGPAADPADGHDAPAGTVPGEAFSGAAEDFAADGPVPAGSVPSDHDGAAGRGDEPTEVIRADRAAGRDQGTAASGRTASAGTATAAAGTATAASGTETATAGTVAREHDDAVTQQIPVVRDPEVSAAALLDDPPVDRDAEPGEETPSAEDGSAAAASTAEVLVVDERPRFHVAGCDWLADRPTIGLPVREAVDLGFTPCAVCRPVTALARS